MSEEAEVPSTSPDPVSDNIEKLKGLFPEAVTEDGIDADVLLQLLGEDVAEGDEKYGLNWHGKKRARQLALTPSAGTLRPCPEDSVDWDNTKNLVIEGDNLEVLKLLQKSYAGKVKLIYIDPPYNTGKDFVYPDNFKDSIGNYLSLTGQVDEEGNKMSSNTESSGRFHTDWLNMMYPRLKLARELLREDGVIFISIDDGEVASLKLILDDVFGSEQFLASIAWKKRSSPDARSTIGYTHDWLLCVVKDQQLASTALGKLPLSEERRNAYKNPDNDPRGPWASVDMTGMTGRATADQYFEVTLPSGRTVKPPGGRSWGIAPDTFKALLGDHRIWFGKSGDSVPRIKRFLSDVSGQAIPTFWDMDEVGSNDEAKKMINELMGTPDVFDTPKPVRLLQRIVQVGMADSGMLVLDFFAGSGTTGHAVMAQNAEDGGDRRYILVQLPEPLDPDNKDQKVAAEYCDELGKPRTITELTKERLRRAAMKVKEDSPDFEGDLGFRALRLDSSNIGAWDPQPEDLEKTLEDSVVTLKDDRDEQDVLYEVLLKLGLDLCVPIETKEIAGAEVHSIGAGTLFACLAEELDAEAVEALAQGIISWRDEIDPAGETTCLFRDSAFPGNVAKTNLNAILEQGGIETVRSI